MKYKILLSSALLISLVILAFVFSTQKTEDFTIAKNQKPSQWFFQQRAFPFQTINRKAQRESIKQSLILRENNKSDFQWIPEGPVNIGGRLTDVELSPGNPETIFLGAASGGVFRSTDNGVHFEAVFDECTNLSIGDIAIASSHPQTIYVGTGEANPGGGSLAYDGDGIYKSTDEGNTWQHIGLPEIGSVGRIQVSPDDENVAYVAAMGYLFENNNQRGVFKTTDGGVSWENILYLNDSTGAIDLAIHPQNPDIIYAATWQRVRRLEYYTYGGEGCGIYRSTDGGENWEELSSGLPSGNNVGRIGIGISHSNPNILYAIYADKIGYFQGLYKSEDAGNSWTQTNDASLSNMYSSYGWWFGRLKIDPNNPEIVYAIGFDLYKTSNSGSSWNMISSNVHVDQHEVAISPENSNHVLIGNDGGLYTSNNGGSYWTHNTQLPITQFYTSAIDFSQPERIYGGAQDNGTNRTMTGNQDDWNSIYWGDGFYCLIDPEDNKYVYAEYQYGNFARSTNYGNSFNSATSGISYSARFNWNTPVAMNPLNPKSLYIGANSLYKSIDRAYSWTEISSELTNGSSSGNQTFGTITTISVSAADTNIIMVGTDDANVWISNNNGGDWINISENLPQRWISRVVLHPTEANSAFVCLSGYRENDYMPHIFKTEDLGQSWQDFSLGLPEAPVNDLIIDPDNSNRFVAATDVGVFYRDENTTEWQALGQGMPILAVTDLTFHSPSNKLVAATYGRSMYSLNLNVGLPNQNNKKEWQFSLTPNPANSYINIRIPQINEKSTIEIYNTNGHSVFSQNIYPDEHNTQINTMDFPSGVYIVSIKNNRVKHSQKLIIQ